MAGDKNASLGVIAMGQRDSRVCCAAAGSRNARHHLERHARFGKKLNLLTATAKYEGIAALEPEHALALLRQPKQHAADLGLRHGMLFWQFADIDALGIAAHEVQDALPNESIIQHDIGALHEPQRLKGQ